MDKESTPALVDAETIEKLVKILMDKNAVITMILLGRYEHIYKTRKDFIGLLSGKSINEIHNIFMNSRGIDNILAPLYFELGNFRVNFQNRVIHDKLRAIEKLETRIDKLENDIKTLNEKQAIMIDALDFFTAGNAAYKYHPKTEELGG